jgi:hypothetical protein
MNRIEYFSKKREVLGALGKQSPENYCVVTPVNVLAPV